MVLITFIIDRRDKEMDMDQSALLLEAISNDKHISCLLSLASASYIFLAFLPTALGIVLQLYPPVGLSTIYVTFGELHVVHVYGRERAWPVHMVAKQGEDDTDRGAGKDIFFVVILQVKTTKNQLSGKRETAWRNQNSHNPPTTNSDPPPPKKRSDRHRKPNNLTPLANSTAPHRRAK